MGLQQSNAGYGLLDYAQLLIDRKKIELGLDEDAYLSKDDLFDSIYSSSKYFIIVST